MDIPKDPKKAAEAREVVRHVFASPACYMD